MIKTYTYGIFYFSTFFTYVYIILNYTIGNKYKLGFLILSLILTISSSIKILFLICVVFNRNSYCISKESQDSHFENWFRKFSHKNCTIYFQHERLTFGRNVTVVDNIFKKKTHSKKKIQCGNYGSLELL